MSQDEFEYPNHSVRVVCGTCGKETFLPPSQAKRRRYCNQVCYDNRPTISLGLAILRLLGGVDVVADWIGLPPRTVRSWATHGIPAKHHYLVLQLVKRKRLGKKITIEKLLETNAFGRAWREGRIGRKASSLSPSPSTVRRRRRAAATAATTSRPSED
jgi:hypothetical protein